MQRKTNKKKVDSTFCLFKNLNISDTVLKKKQINFLNKKGYLIVRKNKFILDNLSIFKREIDKYIQKEGFEGGWEGKKKYYKKNKPFEAGSYRLGNLIQKNIIFSKLILIPEILSCAREVIKDEIKVCGLNYREPKKGYGNQKIHMDWKPRIKANEKFAGIVAMIFFDDANVKNGITRIIPGTHLKQNWPEKYINIYQKNKKEIRPNIKAGDIIILNLNLWHAGADNLNGKRRRMVMLNIKNRRLPQLLNYQKFLSNSVKSKLSEELKYLLAVRKNDKKQKLDSVGVGKYYKKNFQLLNLQNRGI